MKQFKITAEGDRGDFRQFRRVPKRRVSLEQKILRLVKEYRAAERKRLKRQLELEAHYGNSTD